jgi:hypothetical protein
MSTAFGFECSRRIAEIGTFDTVSFDTRYSIKGTNFGDPPAAFFRVHNMFVNAKNCTGAAAGWAVEFDRPSHFLTCRLPVGGTLMKRLHLELLGYTVVSLPFWEWDQLKGSDEREKYHLIMSII